MEDGGAGRLDESTSFEYSMQIVQICPAFNVLKFWYPARGRSTIRACV